MLVSSLCCEPSDWSRWRGMEPLTEQAVLNLSNQRRETLCALGCPHSLMLLVTWCDPEAFWAIKTINPRGNISR